MASEDRKAFLLRIDPKLWAEIEALAGDELRSVNGQIEFLLRQAVQQRRRRPPTQERTDAPSQNGSL
jgi:hypothetical protein